ncbi:hypothetical protein IMZ48_37680 [Candidatus Bathyarchaeota archaeon]|nr:hypothetical protein [Candidatus Bathyarchaeota archaeon]
MPNLDIATRASIVSMKSPFGGKTTSQIAKQTGVPARTITHIYRTAIERGFKPEQVPMIILDDYVKDLPRSGRPKKQTPEIIESTVATVRALKASQAWTYEVNEEAGSNTSNKAEAL